MMDNNSIFVDMSKDELERYLREIEKLLNDEERLKGLVEENMEQFDKNENGLLELDEFTIMMTDILQHWENTISKNAIARIFMETDANHDEALDKEELLPFIKRIKKY